MSIFLKGVLILLCPLVLETVFFVRLHHLTVESERLGQEQLRQVEIVNCMDGIRLELLEAMFSTGPRAIEPNGQLTAEVEAYQQRMSQRLKTAAQMYGSNVEVQQVIKEARTLLDTQLAIIRGPSSQYDSIFSANKMVRLVRLYQITKTENAILVPGLADLARHFDRQIEGLETIKRAVEQNRKAMEQETAIWAGANVAMALIIIVWFLRDITNRLRLLVRNAQAIPELKPLPVSVPGRDELAYLDGVLHSTSEQLRKAADYRKFLTQMVAHDLRSPLVSAELAVDTMIATDDKSTPDTRRSSMKALQGNMRRLVALIEDLLTIEKLDAGKLVLSLDLVDLEEVVNESISGLQSAADHKQVKLENCVPVLVVEADAQRLVQVFNNLISNAIKHAPVSSKIRISATTYPDKIKVTVADEGKGIPEDKLAKIFDRYFQVSEEDARSGYGLGLAIAKSIMVAHGGEIGAENPPGGGACFWIALPSRVDLTDTAADRSET